MGRSSVRRAASAIAASCPVKAAKGENWAAGRSCPSAGDSGMRDAEGCSTSRKKRAKSVTLNLKKVTKKACVKKVA